MRSRIRDRVSVPLSYCQMERCATVTERGLSGRPLNVRQVSWSSEIFREARAPSQEGSLGGLRSSAAPVLGAGSCRGPAMGEMARARSRGRCVVMGYHRSLTLAKERTWKQVARPGRVSRSGPALGQDKDTGVC